jgi:hypothetical protein
MKWLANLTLAYIVRFALTWVLLSLVMVGSVLCLCRAAQVRAEADSGGLHSVSLAPMPFIGLRLGPPLCLVLLHLVARWLRKVRSLHMEPTGSALHDALAERPLTRRPVRDDAARIVTDALR